MKTYRNPKINKNERRESPQDFMQAFLRFIQSNPEHKQVTPKGFAIIRAEREQKAKK